MYFIYVSTYVHVVTEYEDLDLKIDAIQEIIQKLPKVHQYLLLYLLDMLSMFVNAQENTRMDASCLSAVFAPVKVFFIADIIITS